MTQIKIIIGLGVLIGLLLYFKTKTTFLRGILLGLSTCCILGYFTEFPIKTAVYITFGIVVLLFSTWCALKRKWLGLIIGAFTLLSILWIMLNFPYYNILSFLMLIPILCYLWTLIKWHHYKSEISVLTVLVAYEVSELVRVSAMWVT